MRWPRLKRVIDAMLASGASNNERRPLVRAGGAAKSGPPLCRFQAADDSKTGTIVRVILDRR